MGEHRRRWLLSPAIKSWRRTDERRVLALLVDLVDAFSHGQPVALDALSHLHGEQLAERFRGIESKRIRAMPDRSRLARLRRVLGVHVATDAFSAVGRITASDVSRVLSGEILWDSEFFIYSMPDASAPPVARDDDPHQDPERLLTAATWCLGQQDGSFAWVLAAADPVRLDQCVTTARRIFAGHDFAVEVKDEPPGLQSAIGSRVVRWGGRGRAHRHQRCVPMADEDGSVDVPRRAGKTGQRSMNWYAIAARAGREHDVALQVRDLCSSLRLEVEVLALDSAVLLRMEEVPAPLVKGVKKLRHSYGFFGGSSPVVVPDADVEAAKRGELGSGPRLKLEVRSGPKPGR